MRQPIVIILIDIDVDIIPQRKIRDIKTVRAVNYVMVHRNNTLLLQLDILKIIINLEIAVPNITTERDVEEMNLVAVNLDVFLYRNKTWT